MYDELTKVVLFAVVEHRGKGHSAIHINHLAGRLNLTPPEVEKAARLLKVQGFVQLNQAFAGITVQPLTPAIAAVRTLFEPDEPTQVIEEFRNRVPA